MRRWAFVVCLAILPSIIHADHDLDIYAFDHLFIFDTFAGPKPVRRQFNVVVLNDSTDLHVSGTVQTEIDFNVDGYAHYEHYLIVLMMDHITVYDLTDPRCPDVARSFALGNQGRMSGYKGIRREDNGFTFKSHRSAARLVLAPDVQDWTVVDIAKQPVFSKEDRTSASFLRHRLHEAFLIKETDRFRYLVEWEMGQCEDPRRNHVKLLRKRSRSSGDIVSFLILGEKPISCGE